MQGYSFVRNYTASYITLKYRILFVCIGTSDCYAARVPEKKNNQYGDNHETTTHWSSPATQTTFHI